MSGKIGQTISQGAMLASLMFSSAAGMPAGTKAQPVAQPPASSETLVTLAPQGAFNGFKPTYVGSGKNRDQYLPDSATDMAAEKVAQQEELRTRDKEKRAETDGEGRPVLASTQVNLVAPFDKQAVQSARTIVQV